MNDSTNSYLSERVKGENGNEGLVEKSEWTPKGYK